MCIRNFIKYLLGRAIGRFFCTKALLIALPMMLFMVIANAQVLKSMEVVNLQNNVQELRLNFDKDIATPSHFALHQPSRVVLDFSGGRFDGSQRSRTFNNGLLENVVNIKSNGKLRTTIAMTGEVDYSVRGEGSSVIVSLKPKSSALQNGDSWDNSVPSNNPNNGANGTSLGKDVEFSRNSKGSGVVEIMLQSPSAVVKVRDSKSLVSVSISNTQWSSAQERRLDVTSFGTPVKDIAVQNIKGTATVNITAQAGFQYSSYQTGNKYIVELKPVKNSTSSNGAATSSKADGKKEYKGELLSLNFQDIEVRAVLQVIADFTGLNIVVSDDVNSRITVRLQNVPWDQALDVILKTKGLDSRKQGNIIYVAPLEVLSKFDTAKPLSSETIQINYAKAEDIAKVLLDGKKSSSRDSSNTASAGLSARGTVSVDPRTNNLLVQDISEQLVIIRNLIAILDQPVRQVQIDAKVVIATDNFAREIGVKWGVAGIGRPGSSTLIGTSGAAVNSGGAATIVGTGSGGTAGVIGIPSLGDRLGANLGAVGATSGLGLAVLGKDFLVDFELSAMQSNSQGEIISSPRVLTADRKTAYIKQGSEIAYNKLDDSGNTTTSFKEVVLELNVTPQITPDNKIIMDLLVKKDTVDGYAKDGTPTIGKREVNTQALVADGETVVLGGVYEQITSETLKKVPLLADIPWLGNLFKNKNNTTSRAELLIFVTPRLISPNLLRK